MSVWINFPSQLRPERSSKVHRVARTSRLISSRKRGSNSYHHRPQTQLQVNKSHVPSKQSSLSHWNRCKSSQTTGILSAKSSSSEVVICFCYTRRFRPLLWHRIEYTVYGNIYVLTYDAAVNR